MDNREAEAGSIAGENKNSQCKKTLFGVSRIQDTGQTEKWEVRCAISYLRQKVGTGKAEVGGAGETDCQTVRGEKTFGRNTAVQFNGSGNTELFSVGYLYQH